MSGLGDLERSVLDRLWSDGPGDVKAVHASVGRARGLAPNTIQSTLERLHRKGLASRTKQGRAFVYAARLSRGEWLARSLEELVEGVPGLDADTLVTAFVDVAERTGGDHLQALERRVRARRREGDG